LAEPHNTAPVRIYAVIVLYKLAAKDSVSYHTLQAAIDYASAETVTQIAFYDNTPGGQPGDDLPKEIRRESYGENRGLAIPYNHAMEAAHQDGFDWLLTLDQDTSLPIDFISKLRSTLEFVTPLTQVAAVVPRIYDGDRLISPNGLLFDIFPRFLPDDFIGVSLLSSTSAINSASTVRISALQAVGGYDPRFPLDYCDAIMYHRLHAAKFRIFVAGQIRVEHELSVLDMKNRVTPPRYESILGAESAFWDECMGVVADVSLLLRYLYRIFYKLWQTGGSFAYGNANLRYFCRRVFYSRKHRRKLWDEAVKRDFSSRS
jgi:GT2 family glycosyltransferase